MDDYRKMRLFSTPEGDAGFALKGDDIVSVFKHPKAPYRGVTKSMLDIATAEGGRRLDAFDTVLPHIYSQSGFRAAARLPFNDQYAPEGWDHEVFRDHNGGRPDVVFMSRDPQAGLYQPGDGQRIDDYDHGEHHQRRVLDEVERRGPTTPAAPGPESYGSGQLIRLGEGQTPIRIFHGTPHEFKGTRANPLGEFDMSKLGSGEGAQAYGRGIYQAEHEGIAKGYRDELSQGVTYKGQRAPFSRDDPHARAVHEVTEAMGEGLTAEQAIAKVEREYRDAAADAYNFAPPEGSPYAEAHRRRSQLHMGVHMAAQRLEPKDFAKNEGQLYESELHIHPDHMLDWDKPIEHQSQYVQDRLKDVLLKGVPHQTGEFIHGMLQNGVPVGFNEKGQPLYDAQAALSNPDRKARAARELLSRGIPGMRYADADSRRHVEEAYQIRRKAPFAPESMEESERRAREVESRITHNHVVFDPRTIHIVKRNGLPAMVDAGADALRDYKRSG